jgi:hypothetical protein
MTSEPTLQKIKEYNTQKRNIMKPEKYGKE